MYILPVNKTQDREVRKKEKDNIISLNFREIKSCVY